MIKRYRTCEVTVKFPIPKGDEVTAEAWNQKVPLSIEEIEELVREQFTEPNVGLAAEIESVTVTLK